MVYELEIDELLMNDLFQSLNDIKLLLSTLLFVIIVIIVYGVYLKIFKRGQK